MESGKRRKDEKRRNKVAGVTVADVCLFLASRQRCSRSDKLRNTNRQCDKNKNKTMKYNDKKRKGNASCKDKAR